MPLYLLPLFPLLGFALLILFPRLFPGRSAGWLGSLTVLASFVVAVLRYLGQTETPAHEVLWTWLPNMALNSNLAVGFYLDQLSALMALIITGVGFLIHVYSISYMGHDPKFTRFFAFMNFFVGMMLILVLADSYPLMFVGWEGVGVASYLLIGFWFSGRGSEASDKDLREASDREGVANSNAARKAFIMNRIGDLGFMLGMFLLYKLYGTLVIPELAGRVAGAQVAQAGIELACLFLLVGAVGKSGQLPLTTWLPDAMAGPTPVSALIHAATMVTAGVYLIARSHFLYDLAPTASMWVAWVGALTALYGALSALNQHDIKKILAYSTVSQLGYMFLAVGLHAYSAGVFHLLTHAFFKALLFLSAGAVIHALHEEQDVRAMGGMRKFMPFTHIAALMGVLAISGIPIWSGFFSKDAILAAAFTADPLLYVVGLSVALLTAFYMGRWYFLVWRGEYRGHVAHPHEADGLVKVPLGILAALATFGGFLNVPAFLGGNHAFDTYLSRAIPLHPHEIPVATEGLLTVLAVVAGVGGLLWALAEHRRRTLANGPLGQVSSNALYLDRLYDGLFSAPSRAIAEGLDVVDRGVDSTLGGIARNSAAPGGLFTLWQSGFVRAYAVSMLLGTALIIGYWALKTIGGGGL
ncbi:NADH-quinone oxidoreductase subunit L [Deinococcus metallilatus]|uniref:NADH-quinone oxidoreductase subunit L n=1 Tax=Deinococcus metallilatus TaxID=1211322 RepID=A0AAJ5F1Q6_9DEIO|nr:NADH-quinone oxidoreductase subunit L [Deinococcus metallilatus]MBB5294344.1 NADH-quinone oxidoreductase subunit L [Deinococcus metallilatus]QBY09114.1 NADH-quinone oxidoreductase subunit L [Deinococcus metallilatus]RXJ10258.1 NADH-quinone oxidoreductase subunit L [Deinococcus metallilatus]TLK22550.1 NADH-quinone oxidoreductase subunit L [Deinococcus metallilatus]GMA16318.1 NADH-quinone oxidoreductase subunit L [Deinococcus metallilatus]